MRTTIPVKVVDNPDQADRREQKISRSKLKENRSGRFLTRLQIDEIVRRTAALQRRVHEYGRKQKTQNSRGYNLVE